MSFRYSWKDLADEFNNLTNPQNTKVTIFYGEKFPTPYFSNKEINFGQLPTDFRDFVRIASKKLKNNLSKKEYPEILDQDEDYKKWIIAIWKFTDHHTAPSPGKYRDPETGEVKEFNTVILTDLVKGSERLCRKMVDEYPENWINSFSQFKDLFKEKATIRELIFFILGLLAGLLLQIIVAC